MDGYIWTVMNTWFSTNVWLLELMAKIYSDSEWPMQHNAIFLLFWIERTHLLLIIIMRVWNCKLIANTFVWLDGIFLACKCNSIIDLHILLFYCIMHAFITQKESVCSEWVWYDLGARPYVCQIILTALDHSSFVSTWVITIQIRS